MSFLPARTRQFVLLSSVSYTAFLFPLQSRHSPGVSVRFGVSSPTPRTMPGKLYRLLQGKFPALRMTGVWVLLVSRLAHCEG